jgi:pimeloyl-ACP methyl ester carboxylesterase
VLSSGLDDQMISSWPDGFCEALAGAGFHVVRYDHRDAGLSTHFTGKTRAYELTDMTDDMMAVLDAMGWESANLAGLSMGGGLAQFAALRHPDRVRTLTLISSIPMQGQPKRGMARYLRFFPGPFKLVFRRYGDSQEERQRMVTDIIRLTEARSLSLDGEWVRRTAAESVRHHTPDRYARSGQFAAGYAAKLPDGGIARLTQPVLVLNGDEDPLIRAPRGPRAGQGGAPRPSRPGSPHGAPALGTPVAGTGQRDQPARQLNSGTLSPWRQSLGSSSPRMSCHQVRGSRCAMPAAPINSSRTPSTLTSRASRLSRLLARLPSTTM